MSRLRLSAVCLLMFFAELTHAQVFDEIVTSDTCSYFGESVPDKVTTFASDQEAEGVIKKIVDASGLVQNFQIRAAGVPNAAAVIQGESRFILYSQNFMQNMRSKTGNVWAPISIMAHEVGHHLNGHTLGRRGSRPKIELEADYFSGFIVQQMGGTMDDARVAMDTFAGDSASDTHPAKRDRLAAISSGWTKACESDPRCGNASDPNGGVKEPTPTRPKPRKDPTQDTQDVQNSCKYAEDGECDEPDLCDIGTDTADCKSSRRRRTNDPEPVGTQQPLYCCDQVGRKWCQITMNPGPPGTPCLCAGVPGSGWICQ